MKVINLWNNYVGEKCYLHEDEVIYTNDCAVFNTFFTPNENDDYVVIDENNNAQSFTNWDDAKSPVDIDILVDWLFEKEN